ncbi:hypothetical protein DYB37_002826 [Aphanomyces astaci]|uniref:GRIP domain-containing protein n=1 Tax=Aphanomyces astaci TaxID=112090 RepID=A0A3R6WX69_APHAT|nr:hypothetical protein DYB35_002120 [Aphanomyces astaci]RHZ34474.1 hypothetical protein DYB37_002826 [Aphanomyces astaci]
MKSAFGMKNVKKENLEKGLADMKEMGIGGLSKGLNFLRTASQTAMAPGDEDKATSAASASARASSFNGSSGVEKPKMSYDELLSLSMKLTKQNKAYKAALTQASDKLFQAGEIEANYSSLVQFVSEDVGVDLVFVELKVPPMTSDDNGTGGDSTSYPVEKLLDASAMRQLYHARDSARELQVRDMEDKYVNEINQLRAKVETSRDLINLDSPAKQTLPDPATASLQQELESLRTTLEVQGQAHAASVAESDLVRQQLESQLLDLQGQLSAAQSSYATDMAAHVAALESKEEVVVGLKHDLQQQQQLILKLQSKAKDLGAMGQRVQVLEQENAGHVKDIHRLQTIVATHASDVAAREATAEAARASQFEASAAELSELRGKNDAQALQLTQLHAAVAELQTELATARESHLTQADHDQAVLRDRQSALDTVQSQVRALEQAAVSLRSERDADSAQLTELRDQVKDLTTSIEAKARHVQELEATIQLQAAELLDKTAQKEQVAEQWQHEATTLRQQLHDANVSLCQRTDDYDSVKSQLVAAQQAVAADASDKVAMLQQVVTHEQLKVQELTASLHAKASQVNALESTVADLDRAAREALRQAEADKAAHAAGVEYATRLQTSLEQLQVDVASTNAAKIAVETELERLKAALQESVAAHERNESSLNQAATEALAAKVAMEAEVARLENAVEAATTRAAQAESDKSAEADRLQQTLEDARTAAVALADKDRAEADKLRQDVATHRDQVLALQAQLDTETSQRVAQVHESQTQLAQLQVQLEVATSTVQSYTTELSSHVDMIHEKDARLAALQVALDDQEARLAESRQNGNEVAALQAKLLAIEQEAAAHLASIDALHQQVTAHQTELASVQATAAATEASFAVELQNVAALRVEVEAKTADLQLAHAQLQRLDEDRLNERERLHETTAACQAELEAVQARLAAVQKTADAYAQDIQSQMAAAHDREENMAALKQEMQLAQANLGQRLHTAETDASALANDVARLRTELATVQTELASRTAELRTAQDAADAAKANVEAELRETRVVAAKTLEGEVARLTLKWKEMEGAWAAQKAENGRMAKEMHTLHKTWSEKNALAARLHAENVQLGEASAGMTAEVAQLRLALTDQSQALRQVEDAVKEQSDVAAARALDVIRVEAALAEAAAAHARRQDEWQGTLHAMEVAAREREADLQQKFAAEVEKVEADGRAKSKLARQMVLEKEELIASLTTKLAKVEEDVRSGDADHRRIFELASMQANRDATSRSREQEFAELTAAFEQVRLQNAQLIQDKEALEDDIAHLVRTERREGVNMEYLKNVVVQFMSFRPGSSQQLKLIPVLSMLLQFTPEDMDEVQASTKQASSWTSSWSEKKPVRNINAPSPIVIPPRKKVGSPRSLNSPSKSSSPRSSPRGSSPRSKARRSMSPPKQRAMTAQEPLVHHDSIDL